MENSKIDEIKFHSECLGKEMFLLVYLPENYISLSAIPVLYFLHGRTGDEKIMYEANISTTADEMINSKEINPLIIVCPRIENSRGINSSVINSEVLDSKNRVINIGLYEDYFIKEVIPFIDNKYNTVKDRKGRFIGGASAGGYAALHNALRHQDMFSKVGGHMPALELQLEDEDKPYFNNQEIWQKYDPISIAKKSNIIQDMKFYLDAGDSDEGRFYQGCQILKEVLKSKSINADNYIFNGHHNVEYIKSNIHKYLEFYGL